MKNLRNIKTKKGDIIYFEDGRIVAVNDWVEFYSNYKDLEDRYGQIIKIERPVKYETVYEAPKPILDKEEKEYLENVIRPFKNKVEDIGRYSDYDKRKEYIEISIQSDTPVCLPWFSAGSMYKGMELDEAYTIKELGLFEGEE